MVVSCGEFQPCHIIDCWCSLYWLLAYVRLLACPRLVARVFISLLLISDYIESYIPFFSLGFSWLLGSSLSWE